MFSTAILEEGRRYAAKIFEKIYGHGRFLGYSETENNRLEIKDIVVSSEKETTLEEIVFTPTHENPECTHSVSLCGRGGAGKTHEFIKLIDIILNGKLTGGENGKRVQCYSEVVPLYLKLHTVTAQDVGNSILKRLSQDIEIKYEELCDLLRACNSKAIIFADGMNEVTDPGLRVIIANAICDIRESYHTRIVLSSRVDHTALFNSRDKGVNQKFESAIVQDLTEKQVDKYFNTLNLPVRYKDIPYETRPLLKTAQGLSMYADMIKRDPEHILQFTKMGKLLQSYCDRIMGIDRMAGVADFKFEKKLSEVAYNMAKSGCFSISLEELRKIIGEEHIDKFTSDSQVKLIFLPHDQNTYEFTHQNFRDYYAGFFLANVITSLSRGNLQTKLSEYLKNDNVTGSIEILSLCSDFLTSIQIQRAIDLFKQTDHDSDNENDSTKSIFNMIPGVTPGDLRNHWKEKSPSGIANRTFGLSVLIKLYSLVNDNDISKLKLDGLDLRSICLSDYKLYCRDPIGNIDCVSLCNTKISEDTFLQNTLQTAASTICKYTYNGKEYVAAFSTTNVLIYDVEKNSWKCIRNLPNNGWVNCCCVLESTDKTRVIIGSDNGIISSFDPSNNQIEILYNAAVQENYGIESIYCVRSNNQKNTLIFCNSVGTVFARELDAPAESASRILHQFDSTQKKSVEAAFAKKGLRTVSRLTISHQYVYLCFGSDIWRCELPISEKTGFEKFISLRLGDLIKDIYYTDNIIFLNKCKEITTIDCITKEESVSSYTVENLEDLSCFTNFSPDINNKATLVGVIAQNNNYENLANFYRIFARFDADEERYRCSGVEIPHGLQKLATYSAVYFNVSQGGIPRLATVSDDRSVQILTPDNEDAISVYHKGAYNGIHSIDWIQKKELLVAQYDGSVSHWKRNQKGWRCRDVFHIHNGWVWKVMHYKEKENLFFISCSYDGTLRRTNLKTGESEVLIFDRNHKPILDFAATLDSNGFLHSVYAITEKSMYLWQREGENVKLKMKPQEIWSEYSFRSIFATDMGKPYIAVNCKLLDGRSNSYVFSWSNANFHQEIEADTECDFIRCLKLYNFSHYRLLIIGGDHQNKQYVAFYLYNGMNWEFQNRLVTESLDAGRVNDFVTFDFDKLNVSCTFTLGVVYKNNTISCYNITVEDHKIILSDSVNANHEMESQPMCVSCFKADNETTSNLAIGLLNGDVFIVEIDENHENNRSQFHTYADLNVSTDVSLKDADFCDDNRKADFQREFLGYFNFEY